jgi:hypothetical protein
MINIEGKIPVGPQCVNVFFLVCRLNMDEFVLRCFRLALGSFVEEYNNKVQIVSLDEDTSEFSAKSTFDHPYPTTKIMWIPDSVSNLHAQMCLCNVHRCFYVIYFV